MSRILLLTHEFPPFLGGIGTYACQMARAASDLGHEVTVSAPDYGGDLAAEDHHRYPFRVERFRGARYSEGRLPGLLTRVRKLVRSGEFDLIHAVDWPHLLGLGLWNKLGPVPFVATTYGTEVLGSARSRFVRAIGGGRVFEAPERVFAISEYTRNLLLDSLPRVDPDRVDVTPLGVSPFWFQRPIEGAALREAYRIPGDHRVVLTASRIDPRKGHRVALKALTLLPKEIKQSLSYVVVGKGDDPVYLAELQGLAAGSGVHVVFAGGVSDDILRGFYGLASVFCMPGEPHPKKVEGFGLVFLEAAAQGLPSIASDVGAVAEVVRDERTGLIVPPMDPRSLADGLQRLLVDEDCRSRLGRTARSESESYTWERCARLSYGGAARPGIPEPEFAVAEGGIVR